MQLWRRHPWLLRGFALLLSLAGAVLPSVLKPEVVAGLEDRVGDAVWKLGSTARDERRVVLVDIDEKSLVDIGPWPWSRATMADLGNRLSAAGVHVQAYDIAFPDARADDAELQAAWAKLPVVIAQVFSIDAGVTPTVGKVAGAVSSRGCPTFAPRSFGAYGTADTLLAGKPTVGHITPRVGSDGVVRQVPALVCHLGSAYPSLALATLWQAAQPLVQDGGRAAAAPDWAWHTDAEPSPFPIGLSPPVWLTSSSLPGLAVPLDRAGNLRVPYGVSRQAMASVSASDLIKGRVDTAVLNGAIVVVGATAFGIGDTVATPLGAVASGLEVHAQSIVGLLDQRVPYTPARWPFWQGLSYVVLAVVLLATVVPQRGVPAKRLPLVGLALAVVVMGLACLAQAGLALWLPWLSLSVFCLLASVSLATVEHALVRAQRERLSAHLGAYLPAPVAQHLMASEPSGSVQLEPRDICVLVADVRNFAAFATHCSPVEVASFLHSFCCLAVDVVERHGGVVDNVVGDCIVAVWPGSPGSKEHSTKAMAAAQDLLKQARPLLASSQPVAESNPVQPLALGVGLETGIAIVGSFGPTRRRAHTALGEPVSVAKRIQQMTADLSIPILVGPQLAALLPAEGVEPLGEYLLEGLGRHYQLFAPAGWTDLAYVDSNWATSAAGDRDKSQDAAEWSGWGRSATHSVSTAWGLSRALATIRRGSA